MSARRRCQGWWPSRSSISRSRSPASTIRQRSMTRSAQPATCTSSTSRRSIASIRSSPSRSPGRARITCICASPAATRRRAIWRFAITCASTPRLRASTCGSSSNWPPCTAATTKPRVSATRLPRPTSSPPSSAAHHARPSARRVTGTQRCAAASKCRRSPAGPKSSRRLPSTRQRPAGASAPKYARSWSMAGAQNMRVGARSVNVMRSPSRL